MSTMHEFDPSYPRPTDTPKFTPGPWYAVPDAHSEYRGRDVDLRVRGESSTVALVPEDGNGDANARLIAAATELYEALARIMPFVDDADDVQELFPESAASQECREAVKFCRAALAKAVQP